MNRSQSPRPTLQDVAHLAGVSLGSASRALSVPDQVKPATLAQVRRAVEQLGYVSNGAARALASKRTYTIGAVYPTMYNQAFVESLHTLQQTLWEFNYQLVLAIHEYKPEREYEVVRAIVERGVDGVVLVATSHSEDVFDLVRHRRLPLVVTWQLADPRYGECVGFDNKKALHDMTREVLARGHRDIGVICGYREHNERSRQRFQGTVDALKEAGLAVRPEAVIETPFSIEGGRAGLRQLAALARRPTAVLCHTDLQAIGALHECGVLGIRVPEDLSITGMDDIELAALTKPALTTLKVPTKEIGALSARLIVSMIEDKPFHDQVELECPVVLRDSLGPAPTNAAAKRGRKSPAGA